APHHPDRTALRRPRVEWTPTPPAGGTVDVAFTRSAFAGATATFVVVGATASLYGPLLDTFARHFGVSLPAAGAVVSVHFAGALLGVPLGWVALRRIPGSAALALGLATMALGTAGAALAGTFPELLASVVGIGLGFGALDFVLNSLLVRTADAGRAHRLSVANAGYGVGAVLGPLLVIAARPTHFALIFASVGLAALAITVSVRGVEAARLERAPAADHHPRRRAVLATFVTGYVLYVATESSAAGWIAPQLHRTGFAQATGAAATAGFWLGLTVGRLTAGPLHRRVSERAIVLVGLGATVALALSALAHDWAPVAYPLAGVSLALVYPMGLIWFTGVNPGDGDGLAILVLVMMSGGVVGPALTSAAVSMAGVRAVPVCVAAFSAADLAVFLAARRFRAPGAVDAAVAPPVINQR
ncbi:MAG TPA: MFS transporter, partial [Acidimicrobiales bacterium]|nr:MFS transporter [Acidimicrobiales bacterium]